MCREIIKRVVVEVWAFVKSFHQQVVLNIYDGYKQSRVQLPVYNSVKIDSRKIEVPRFRNMTEMVILSDPPNATRAQKSLPTRQGHPFTNLDPRIIYTLDYKVPEVHASIYWFKYRRDKYTTQLMGRILWDEIIFQISDKLDVRKKINKWFISPAPSTSFEMGKKDWDHNNDLLQAFEKNIRENYSEKDTKEKIEIVPIKLFAINHERKNVDVNKKLGRRGRLDKTVGKFCLSKNIKIEGEGGLIIFDDVATTGATLLELSHLAQKLDLEMTILISIAH